MTSLVNTNRSKTNLLKYIFLSTSLCVLLAIIVTIYLKDSPITPESSKKPAKNSKTLSNSKEYSLAINQLSFEGFSRKSMPYKILADTVTKNHLDQYILNSVNGQCSLNNNENITIQSTSGTLDDTNKIAILHNDVKIFLNNIVLNSEEIQLNLENQDVHSDSAVEVNSEQANIKADSFDTKELNNIIEFKGNVEAICNIEQVD